MLARTKTVAPIQAGAASSGINSFAFKNSLEGVVTGGNYEGDNSTIRGQNFAVTIDGGKTWKNLEPEKSPSKYNMTPFGPHLQNHFNGIITICVYCKQYFKT